MADNSHKRGTTRRKPTAVTLAGTLAVLATGAAVVTGVVAQDPAEPASDLVASDPAASSPSSDPSTPEADDRERQRAVSRSGSDRIADARAMRPGNSHSGTSEAEPRWTTEELNLWSAPGKGAEKIDVISEGEKLHTTGETEDGRIEVIVDSEALWVTQGYLDEEKPEEAAPESGGSASGGESSAESGTGGTCSNGTSVPAGVSPYISSVHQAVCARWPSISSYGTFRSDGEHGQGRAIDIMISGSTGWDIAEYLRANAGSLGIEYIMYSQKIWSVERSSEGWRYVEDRGSATANHYDHVHVTTH